MPMISAMMVMTTSNSTSVNPRWARSAERRALAKLRMPTPSADDLADRQKRRHHRYDEAADDNRNRDDRGRSGDPDHAVETALQLGFVEFRDASREHRQLPCFLTQT